MTAFGKKKAQGACVVTHKCSPVDSKGMERQLAALGQNLKQLAKRVNEMAGADRNAEELIAGGLKRALDGLGEIWRQRT